MRSFLLIILLVFTVSACKEKTSESEVPSSWASAKEETPVAEATPATPEANPYLSLATPATREANPYLSLATPATREANPYLSLATPNETKANLPDPPAESHKYISSRTCESGHWVDSVSDDGEIVKLEDGSVWEVDAGDTVDSMLWLPTTNVLACPHKLINTEDNETVGATRLK